MKRAITVLVSCLATVASNVSSAHESPFLPAGYISAQKSVRVTLKQQSTLPFNFQLKGIVLLSGTYYFSIFDPKTGRSAWLENDDSFNGLTIIGLQENELVVHYNNEQRILPLAHADDRQVPVFASLQTPNTLPPENQKKAISRRPTAFTARALIQAKTENPTTSIEATRHSQSFTNDSNQHPQTVDIELPPNTYDEESLPLTVETASASTAKDSTSNFNNRFGIDKSRIQEAL